MADRKKITYRPPKAMGVMGGVMGLIFAAIGIFVAIPTFGAFGVLWTLVAVFIGVFSLGLCFGGHAGGEITIESEPAPEESAAPAATIESRLEQLSSLYDRGLIDRTEYEEKRRDILRDL